MRVPYHFPSTERKIIILPLKDIVELRKMDFGILQNTQKTRKIKGKAKLGLPAREMCCSYSYGSSVFIPFQHNVTILSVRRHSFL